ncbi:hypothetical protein OpiT1DRAFT_02415 [Opitutaceae bacterium TAV1]|nr:hypothetical protein OpiT1DRAFT_02415 [Opitutaceae bacterium TAV1]
MFPRISTLPLLALVVPLAFTGAAPARAELAIKPDDIHNGRYIYRLTREDMQTLTPASGKIPDWDWIDVGNKFFDDVHSFSNLRMQGGAWAFISMKPGASAAEFVYKFDFTPAGVRPVGMRLREIVRIEQDGATYQKRSRTGFTSFYRIGESGEWIPLNSAAPDVGFRGDKAYLTDPLKFDAGASSVVYYKVVFISDQPVSGGYLKKGQPGGNPDRGGPLWNLTRQDQPDRFFQVVFQVEPAK